MELIYAYYLTCLVHFTLLKTLLPKFFTPAWPFWPRLTIKGPRPPRVRYWLVITFHVHTLLYRRGRCDPLSLMLSKHHWSHRICITLQPLDGALRTLMKLPSFLDQDTYNCRFFQMCAVYLQVGFGTSALYHPRFRSLVFGLTYLLRALSSYFMNIVRCENNVVHEVQMTESPILYVFFVFSF